MHALITRLSVFGMNIDELLFIAQEDENTG